MHSLKNPLITHGFPNRIRHVQTGKLPSPVLHDNDPSNNLLQDSIESTHSQLYGIGQGGHTNNIVCDNDDGSESPLLNYVGDKDQLYACVPSPIDEISSTSASIM